MTDNEPVDVESDEEITAKRKRHDSIEKEVIKRTRNAPESVEDEPSHPKRHNSYPVQRRKPFQHFDDWLSYNRYLTYDGVLNVEFRYVRSKYEDYVRNFVYEKENEFFFDHRDEEWFIEAFEVESVSKNHETLEIQYSKNFKQLKEDSSIISLEAPNEIAFMTSDTLPKLVGQPYDPNIIVQVPAISSLITKEVFKSNVFDFLATDQSVEFKFNRPEFNRRNFFYTSCLIICADKAVYDRLIDKKYFFIGEENNENKIEFQRFVPATNKFTHILFSQPSRIRKDIEIAKNLVNCYDEKYGNDFNLIYEPEKFDNLGNKDKIDTLISYLRKVYYICYYTVKRYLSEGDMLSSNYVPRLRPIFTEETVIDPRDNGQQHDADVEYMMKHMDDVEKKYEDLMRLEKQMINEMCGRSMSVEEESKVRCKICEKLFRGEEFVKKHIMSKHEEEVEEARKRAKSKAFKRNFFEIENKPIKSVYERLKEQRISFLKWENANKQKEEFEFRPKVSTTKARTTLDFAAL